MHVDRAGLALRQNRRRVARLDPAQRKRLHKTVNPLGFNALLQHQNLDPKVK